MFQHPSKGFWFGFALDAHAKTGRLFNLDLEYSVGWFLMSILDAASTVERNSIL